jgi:hypothetical protein
MSENVSEAEKIVQGITGEAPKAKADKPTRVVIIMADGIVDDVIADADVDVTIFDAADFQHVDDPEDARRDFETGASSKEDVDSSISEISNAIEEERTNREESDE